MYTRLFPSASSEHREHRLAWDVPAAGGEMPKIPEGELPKDQPKAKENIASVPDAAASRIQKTGDVVRQRQDMLSRASPMARSLLDIMTPEQQDKALKAMEEKGHLAPKSGDRQDIRGPGGGRTHSAGDQPVEFVTIARDEIDLDTGKVVPLGERTSVMPSGRPGENPRNAPANVQRTGQIDDYKPEPIPAELQKQWKNTIAAKPPLTPEQRERAEAEMMLHGVVPKEDGTLERPQTRLEYGMVMLVGGLRFIGSHLRDGGKGNRPDAGKQAAGKEKADAKATGDPIDAYNNNPNRICSLNTTAPRKEKVTPASGQAREGQVQDVTMVMRDLPVSGGKTLYARDAAQALAKHLKADPHLQSINTNMKIEAGFTRSDWVVTVSSATPEAIKRLVECLQEPAKTPQRSAISKAGDAATSVRKPGEASDELKKGYAVLRARSDAMPTREQRGENSKAFYQEWINANTTEKEFLLDNLSVNPEGQTGGARVADINAAIAKLKIKKEQASS
ncbi:MAG: hypothetical protein G01um101425_177 [Candidatus Peregrinibacteria bacterium Gr01-1014_25]|nr:MAG: hypothetical protein G01um101425_177 [Candidatus Peregrinibacteria bacterium Gr01-1014_25]